MGLFFPDRVPQKDFCPETKETRVFIRFFSILFRKFWSFIKVNILYVAAMIPTYAIVFLFSCFLLGQLLRGLEVDYIELGAVYFFGGFILSNIFTSLWGVGPATAGVTYLMRNYAKEEHAWILSDFWDAVKGNWKQSFAIFGIDLIVIVVFFVSISAYIKVGGILGMMRYVVYVAIVLYSMMHLYLYPMMITFDLSLKELYSNALVFALGKLPANLLILLVIVGIHIVFPVCIVSIGMANLALLLPLFLLVEWLILYALSEFLKNFFVYPKLKKYMLDENNA